MASGLDTNSERRCSNCRHWTLGGMKERAAWAKLKMGTCEFDQPASYRHHTKTCPKHEPADESTVEQREIWLQRTNES